MPKLLVVAPLVIILALYLGYNYLPQKNSSLNPTQNAKNNLYSEPLPTPFEFQDMTIPYLKAKEYKSNLTELTKYSENTNYTSYLTSYTSDGLKINGLLTRPKADKPDAGFPAIVFIHGYIPPNIYSTTERYSDYIDYLARNGFVVFKIDLRGNGDSEGEPGGAYYSPDYVIDALNAYAALQSADFVNPKAIGLWGHSMAGNVSLRALATKPEIPATVIWAGAGFTYEDLQQYRIMDLSYRPQPTDTERQRKRQRMRDLYGNPDPNHWFWKQVIPTNYLSDITGAIALHHAVDDATVNIEYSRNLDSILDITQIPHELHEYPNGGHNIQGSSWVTAIQRTVDFYKQQLK